MVNHTYLGDQPSVFEAHEMLSKMTELNINALIMMTRLVTEQMDHSQPGHIINVGSMVGHKVYPIPITHTYTGTKFAVRAMTEATKQELTAIKSRVRCSLFSPGKVCTEFLQVAGENLETRSAK